MTLHEALRQQWHSYHELSFKVSSLGISDNIVGEFTILEILKLARDACINAEHYNINKHNNAMFALSIGEAKAYLQIAKASITRCEVQSIFVNPNYEE